jgi:hypothetical protein
MPDPTWGTRLKNIARIGLGPPRVLWAGGVCKSIAVAGGVHQASLSTFDALERGRPKKTIL